MEEEFSSSSQTQAIRPDQAAQSEVPELEKSVDKDKKAKLPGITPEDHISEAGRIILRFHFERMISCEAGATLGEDIEALHDMRVAARRMRVALELFAPFFKKKAVQSYINGLRSTTRALGRVRDLDVFLGKLNEYIESLPEHERPSFEIFVSQWRKKHNKAQSKKIRFLNSDQYQLFKRQFGQFLNTPGEGVKHSKIIQPNQVRDLAPIMIYKRLAAVRAYEQVLGNTTIKELHTLRMQLKKLRYMVEFFCDVLGPESKEVIRDIKTLQDHLGNLNDADVACQIINGFIAQLKKEQVALPVHERLNPAPIFTYLAAKSEERNRLIATFPNTWQGLMGKAFSKKIAKTVSVF